MRGDTLDRQETFAHSASLGLRSHITVLRMEGGVHSGEQYELVSPI